MNNRQMQFYGAYCLSQYCKFLKINNSCIQELLDHLFHIMTVPNLADWEQQGTSIGIIGRGDPIPDEVLALVPKSYQDDFKALVEYSIEIGIVDMYGGSTNDPKIFFDKCISLVNKENIYLLSTDKLHSYANGEDAWGIPIDNDDFNLLLNYFGVSH